MAFKDQVLEAITSFPGRTDRELTEILLGRGKPQQHVNAKARELEGLGLVQRNRRHDGLIGNYRTNAQPGKTDTALPPAEPAADPSRGEGMSEDEVKQHLKTWLEQRGWDVSVAWAYQRGIDIEAKRPNLRWVIEVAGSGSRPEMRGNYFLVLLAAVLQRMEDPKADYSIALPDLQPYRTLWARLPALAKERCVLSALFVSKNGKVEIST